MDQFDNEFSSAENAKLVEDLKASLESKEIENEQLSTELKELKDKFMKFKLQAKAKITSLNSQLHSEQNKSLQEKEVPADNDNAEERWRGKLLIMKKRLDDANEALKISQENQLSLQDEVASLKSEIQNLYAEKVFESEFHQKIARKDAIINTLSEQEARLRSTVSSLQHSLAQKETNLRARDRTIQELEAKLSQEAVELNSSDQVLHAMSEKIESYEEKIGYLTEELQRAGNELFLHSRNTEDKLRESQEYFEAIVRGKDSEIKALSSECDDLTQALSSGNNGELISSLQQRLDDSGALLEERELQITALKNMVNRHAAELDEARSSSQPVDVNISELSAENESAISSIPSSQSEALDFTYPTSTAAFGKHSENSSSSDGTFSVSGYTTAEENQEQRKPSSTTLVSSEEADAADCPHCRLKQFEIDRLTSLVSDDSVAASTLAAPSTVEKTVETMERTTPTLIKQSCESCKENTELRAVVAALRQQLSDSMNNGNLSPNINNLHIRKGEPEAEIEPVSPEPEVLSLVDDSFPSENTHAVEPGTSNADQFDLELQSLKQENAQLHSGLQETLLNVRDLQSEKDILANTITNLQQKLQAAIPQEQCEQNLRAISNELQEQQNENISLREQIVDITRTNSTLRDELSSRESEISETNAEKVSSAVARKSAEREINDLTKFNSELCTKSQQLEDTVRQLEAQLHQSEMNLIEVKEDYDARLSEVLSAQGDAENNSKDIIQKLTDLQSVLVSKDEIITELSNERKVLMLEKESLAGIVDEMNERLDTLSLENDKVCKQLQKVEISRNEYSDNCNRLYAEIDQLNEQIKVLETNMKTVLTDSQNSSNLSAGMIEKLRDELNDLSSEFSTVNELKADLLVQLNDANSRLSTLTSENKQISAQLDMTMSELAKAQKAELATSDHLKQYKTNKSSEFDEINARLSEATENVTKSEGAIMQLRSNLKDSQEEVHSLKNSVADLERRLCDSTTERDSYALQIDSLVNRNDDEQKNNTVVLAQKEEIIKRLQEELATSTSALNSVQEQFESGMNKKDQELTDSTELCVNLNTELEAKTAELKRIDEDQLLLINSKEELNAELVECKNQLLKIQDDYSNLVTINDDVKSLIDNQNLTIVSLRDNELDTSSQLKASQVENDRLTMSNNTLTQENVSLGKELDNVRAQSQVLLNDNSKLKLEMAALSTSLDEQTNLLSENQLVVNDLNAKLSTAMNELDILSSDPRLKSVKTFSLGIQAVDNIPNGSAEVEKLRLEIAQVASKASATEAELEKVQLELHESQETKTKLKALVGKLKLKIAQLQKISDRHKSVEDPVRSKPEIPSALTKTAATDPDHSFCIPEEVVEPVLNLSSLCDTMDVQRCVRYYKQELSVVAFQSLLHSIVASHRENPVQEVCLTSTPQKSSFQNQSTQSDIETFDTPGDDILTSQEKHILDLNEKIKSRDLKLKKYLDLLSKLKEQSKALKSDNDKLHAAVENLRSENSVMDDLNLSLTTKNAEIAALFDSVASLEKSLCDLTEKSNVVTAENAELKRDREMLGNQIDELTSLLDSSRCNSTDLSSARNEISSLRNENLSLVDERDKVCQLLSDFKIQLNERQTVYDEKVCNLEKELQNLQSELNFKSNQLSQCNEERVMLQETVSKQQSILTNLEETLKSLNDDEAQSKAVRIEHETLRGSFNAVQAEKSFLVDENERLKREFEKLNQTLLDSQNNNDYLSTCLTDTNNLLSEIKSQVATYDDEISALKISLNKTEGAAVEFRNERDNLLKTLDMVKKEMSDIEQVVDKKALEIENLKLQQHEGDQLSASLNDQVSDLKNAIHNLEVICKDHEQTEKKLQCDYDALSTCNKGTNKENLFFKNENARLLDKCKELNVEISQCKLSHDGIVNELTQANSLIETLSSENSSLKAQISETESICKECNTQNDQLGNQVREFETQIEALEKDISESTLAFQSKENALRSENDNLASRCTAFESDVAQLRQKVSRLNDEVDELNLQNTKVVDALSASKKEYDDLIAKHTRVLHEFSAASEENNTLKNQIAQHKIVSTEIANSHKIEVSEYTDKLQSLQSELADRNESIERLKSEMDSAVSELVEKLNASIAVDVCESRLELHQNEIDQLLEKNSRLDLEQQQLLLQVSSLNQALLDKEVALSSSETEKSDLSTELTSLKYENQLLKDSVAESRSKSNTSYNSVFCQTDEVDDVITKLEKPPSPLQQDIVTHEEETRDVLLERLSPLGSPAATEQPDDADLWRQKYDNLQVEYRSNLDSLKTVEFKRDNLAVKLKSLHDKYLAQQTELNTVKDNLVRAEEDFKKREKFLSGELKRVDSDNRNMFRDLRGLSDERLSIEKQLTLLRNENVELRSKLKEITSGELQLLRVQLADSKQSCFELESLVTELRSEITLLRQSKQSTTQDSEEALPPRQDDLQLAYDTLLDTKQNLHDELVSTRHALDDARKHVKELQQNVKSIIGDKENSDQLIAQLHAEAAKLKSLLNEKDEVNLSLNRSLESSDQSHERLLKELSISNNERDATHTQLDDAAAELAETRTRHDELKSKYNASLNDNTRLISQVEELFTKLESTEQQLLNEKAAKTKINESLQLNEQSLLALSGELNATSQALRDRDIHHLSEDDARYQQCLAQLTELQSQFNQLQSTYNLCQQVNNDLTEEKTRLTKELDELSMSNKNLTTERDQLSISVEQAKNEVTTTRQQLMALQARVSAIDLNTSAYSSANSAFDKVDLINLRLQELEANQQKPDTSVHIQDEEDYYDNELKPLQQTDMRVHMPSDIERTRFLQGAITRHLPARVRGLQRWLYRKTDHIVRPTRPLYRLILAVYIIALHLFVVTCLTR